MNRIIVFGAAILVGVASVGLLLPGREPSRTFDFGPVPPGKNLVATFPIYNGTRQPVIYSGFNDSCGVHASMPDNAILSPGQTGLLHVQAKAARTPGPHGSVFKLVSKPAFDKANSITYELKYSVERIPWTAESELNLVKTHGNPSELEGTLRVYNLSQGDRLTVSTPPGISWKQYGGTIQFKTSVIGDAEGGTNLGDVILEILTSDGLTAKYIFPTYFPAPDPRVRFYPSSSWFGRDQKSLRLTLIGDSKRVKSFQVAPGVKISQWSPQYLEIERTSIGPPMIVLNAVDSQNKVVATATLFLAG